MVVAPDGGRYKIIAFLPVVVAWIVVALEGDRYNMMSFSGSRNYSSSELW